jgi:hypothetical protein
MNTTDTIDRTQPVLTASLVSPTGERIDIHTVPAYGQCFLVRYDPTLNETASEAWLRSTVAVQAGIRVCGNYKYFRTSEAFHLIGRLVVEEGWARA